MKDADRFKGMLGLLIPVDFIMNLADRFFGQHVLRYCQSACQKKKKQSKGQYPTAA